MARVDFHCHSYYSDQPIHWLFRKLGARESYTPVEELYQRLKGLGMDFVTITDHNRIDGALELAEKYSDCFVSCEYTVNFYRQPASLHLCAYDITEKQFQEGIGLCGDIREFAEYFREQDVLVTVPHPLHCNRGKLEPQHLEQLLLLFDYFEEMNGLQMETANLMARELFNQLTPAYIEALQKKHGLEPCSPEPWIKGRLGGSDDHSSFFLGRCWTEVEKADNYGDFLQEVRAKRSTAHGRSMTALAFSQATQSNWINAILDHYCKPGSFDERLVKLVSRVRPQTRTRKILNRFLGADGELPPIARHNGSPVKRFFVKRYLRFRLLCLLHVQKRFLEEQATGDCECPAMEVPFFISPHALASFKERISELMVDWRDTDLLFQHREGRDLQEETFAFISGIFNSLYRFSFGQWFYHMQQGNIPEAFARLSLVIPGFLPAVPYLMGYKHFYYDNKYHEQIGRQYNLPSSPTSRKEKWGWFTDTLMDINGAAAIIRRYTQLAKESEISITAITSHPDQPEGLGDNFISFPPLFHFPLPEYDLMTLAIPSILDVLHHCEQQQYTRLVISSPGPVGLLGMWIADLLNIPVTGIYHTDLPSYTGRLTQDPGMEQMAWKLVTLFYGRMDRVYVLSNSYREKLVSRGLRAEKIFKFIKGTDTDFFHPGRDGSDFRQRWGLDDRLIILYVGRVSKEKDLDVLVESYCGLCEGREDLAMVIVGDGPYLAELQQQLGDRSDVVLPGFIEGDELAAIYGGGDIFAFPSTTDTYGTVLLEAQASALPAVVSDAGGPKEVIIDGETGFVTAAGDPESFAAALGRLIDDDEMRKTMGERARIHVAEKSWKNAFDAFVNDHRS